jgi:hypothetical protein
MNKKTDIFRIVILSFIFATTIGYSLADWVPPAGSPPSNNVPPPINVGAASQIKLGNLGVNNITAAGNAYSGAMGAGSIGSTLTTKDYVDGRISTISLTPGPKGDTGATGPSGVSTAAIRSCYFTRGFAMAHNYAPGGYPSSCIAIGQGYVFTGTYMVGQNGDTAAGICSKVVTDGSGGFVGICPGAY